MSWQGHRSPVAPRMAPNRTVAPAAVGRATEMRIEVTGYRQASSSGLTYYHAAGRHRRNAHIRRCAWRDPDALVMERTP